MAGTTQKGKLIAVIGDEVRWIYFFGILLGLIKITFNKILI